MNARMRVLLVIDSLGWGGAQRQMANLAVGLFQRGHDVHLFQYFPQFDHHRAMVERAGVKLIDFHKRRKFDPGVVAALVRQMRSERYDAVVAFLAGPSAFAVAAAKIAGLPVVASERGSFRPGRLPLYLRLQRLTHRLATHVTTNSYHHRDRMLVEFPYLKDRISTIWNGIDTDFFAPTPRDPADARDDGVLRLLGVSTVVPIKNIETFARALVVGKQRGATPARVEWAGKVLDAPHSQEVVARVDAILSAAGLRERWTWLGLQSDVRPLYPRNDALVHPSAREGLPNAVCEALSCGLPVIAARGADHPRLVGEGERGLLFEPGNAESLADSIARLAALGPEGRAALGANARAFAEKSLSLTAFLDHYEALLREIGRPS